MFGFKNRKKKDPYLERVSLVLHKSIGPMLHLDNAYNLAQECLRELRENISRGMFQDGPNPRENIMAYYSLCNMIDESDLSDDKSSVLKITIMARVLKEELGEFDGMTPLEKGIWQFGEHVLSEESGTHTEQDVERIKSGAVEVIMQEMRDRKAPVLQSDVVRIVANVSSKVGGREVAKVGEKILAVSVLSNATGYFLDQGEADVAFDYYACLGSAYRNHFEGNMDSYSEDQVGALRMIMEDYRSLGKELMESSK